MREQAEAQVSADETTQHDQATGLRALMHEDGFRTLVVAERARTVLRRGSAESGYDGVAQACFESWRAHEVPVLWVDWMRWIDATQAAPTLAPRMRSSAQGVRVLALDPEALLESSAPTLSAPGVGRVHGLVWVASGAQERWQRVMARAWPRWAKRRAQSRAAAIAAQISQCAQRLQTAQVWVVVKDVADASRALAPYREIERALTQRAHAGDVAARALELKWVGAMPKTQRFLLNSKSSRKTRERTWGYAFRRLSELLEVRTTRRGEA